MAKLELVLGVLRSVDTNKRLIEIELEDNIIPVIQPGVDKPHEKPLKPYPYGLEFEGQNFDFHEHIGEKVQCRLSDGVVVEIIPLS